MMGHSFVHGLLIIDPIPNKTVYLSVILLQKIRHLGRILFVSLSDLGNQDLAILIYTYVQFLPALTALSSVLLRVPFSLAADLETGAVHNEGHRSIRQVPHLRANTDCSIPAG